MKTRVWPRRAAYLLLLVMAASYGFSFVLRAGRVHRYLVRRLEAAFGRPVEVSRFDFSLLDGPRLEAEYITVGEDPAFGYEYFLRADQLTAGPRWSQLLQGRFEFGTLSFKRPSLNVVRNAVGQWNVERWLPPRAGPGPPPGAASPGRLRRVEFSAGRINFKEGLEKKSYAFVGVDGSAEQESGGRWRLDLRAEPMRAGVSLQEAGVLWVQGRIAGASARLQPAEIVLHWGEASLADVLRLAQGQDFGVRGRFGLDLAVKTGPGGAAEVPRWDFALRTRISGVHRWDLPERADNPALNLNADAAWEAARGRLELTQISIQAPRSEFRGAATAAPSPLFAPRVEWESAGVSLEDLLAWWRAFRPGMAEGLRLNCFLSGSATTRGWPPRLEGADWRLSGGELNVPGIAQPVRMSAAEGSAVKDLLEMGPLALLFAEPARPPATPPARPGPGKRGANAAVAAPRASADKSNSLVLGAVFDLSARAGTVTVKGKTSQAEEWLALAAAFGRPLNRGWELTGGVALDLRWDLRWSDGFSGMAGSAGFDGARIQVAGLNLPVELDKARMDWSGARRKFLADSVQAFGALWSGTLAWESSRTGAPEGASWQFALRADHLDAVELDRWLGPRARPNWFERLLPGLLGGSPAASTVASVLLRNVQAQGDLTVDEFSLAGIKLERLRARTAIGGSRIAVEEGEAEIAGGRLDGKLEAVFGGRPRYTADLGFEGVDLGALATTAGLKDLAGGTATGAFRMRTQGIGREELLGALDGAGEARLSTPEFRGMDLEASLTDGIRRSGRSRWPKGEARFSVRNGQVQVESLRLENAGRRILVRGAVDFKRIADLQAETLPEKKPGIPGPRAGGASLRLSGPVEALEVTVPRKPAEAPPKRKAARGGSV